MPEHTVNRMVQMVAEQSIDRSSQVLSKMLKSGAKIELRRTFMADISEITQKANENNEEVIGSYIDLLGDAPFKFLFFVRTSDAFILTDLFIGEPVGTTTEYNEYVLSTIQEIGNIIASAISNVFVANFQIKMQPSPPVVVRDFSGCIFEEFLVEAAQEKDSLLLIESLFQVVKTEMGCYMYLLPIQGSEKILGFSIG